MTLTIIRTSDREPLYYVHGLTPDEVENLITIWSHYQPKGAPRYTFVVNDVKQNA